MYPFRRPRDEPDDDRNLPIDDSADFCLTTRQQQIRKNAETRKQMERLWAQIQERWRNPWKQD